MIQKKNSNSTLAARSPEELARIVLQNSGDYAIVVLDTSGTIINWTPGAEKVLGWTAGQAVGESCAILFAPDDRAEGRWKAEMDLAVKHGVMAHERWLVKRDGTRFWAAEQLAALNDDGELVGFSLILRDRTCERQTEERLRIAQQAGGIGSFELMPSEGKIAPSEQFCRLWGMPVQSEYDVADFIDLIHQEERSRIVTGNRELPDDALDYTEYRIIRPDTGQVRWMARRGELVHDHASGQQRYIGVSYDITQRKRTELDLRFLARASAELASLVDQHSTLDRLAFLAVPSFADWCTIDLLQEDGTLNRVAVAHIDPAKVQLAREFNRLFPPDPDDSRGLWNVLRSGRVDWAHEISDEMLEQSIKDRARLAALRELGLRSFICVPLSVRGRTLGIATFVSAESARLYNQDDVALAEDLGKRAAVAIENARLYEALQKEDRNKDIFLATLSHELRNPLAAIMNGLSIIRLAPQDKSKVEESARLMANQAEHLARLVDDLMDISRITTGKVELKKECVDLRTILKDVIESNRPCIEAGNHALTITLPDEAAQIMADPVRLAQIFSNLLNNAARYTNHGGHIGISLEHNATEFIVRVRDTGIGISSDMLMNIFKIFAQVDHPLERSKGGLGIGLYLVDALTRLHGGKAEAFSAGKGQGSEFVVRLPRDSGLVRAEPMQSHPPLESMTRTLPNRRMLVVDDNVDAAAMLCEALRILGNEVAIAHDGLTAVAMAAQMKPDVIVLDIGLPQIDGYEAARRIRAQAENRGVILIALTGWGQDEDKQRAADAGFNEHWVKPVNLDKLRQLGERT
ncbi:MAG: putative histidine kinase, hybrid [Noviherbaspirillum sp.]|nr:putative histidine kinase, hybrid [Noviherbaspirillum sp.]